MFYDPHKFKRQGAMPSTIKFTLLGTNAIHTDDCIHKSRKDMFLSLVTKEKVESFSQILESEIAKSVKDWPQKSELILFNEVATTLFIAACKWAGVPLQDAEVIQRKCDMVAMIDGFGSFGFRMYRAMLSRCRSVFWLKSIINDVRNGKLKVEPDKALAVIANFKDAKGNTFTLHTTAVELLNVIRPIVACTWYCVFGALTFQKNKDFKRKFLENKDNYRFWFVEEIRRFYPFAPFMGALSKESIAFKDTTIPPRTLVLLDIYGTNHDERVWDRPNEFRPERFPEGQAITDYNFLPQGGGDVKVTHRCPGETITKQAVTQWLLALLERIEYDVPEQDLSFSLARMPTAPTSGMIIRNVALRA